MLEQRYYSINTFSIEWWQNTTITASVILLLIFISKLLCNNNKKNYFNIILGTFLLIRLCWLQWYHFKIGIWNVQWSLPLQLCSFSTLLAISLAFIENTNISNNIKQFLFEFLFYFNVGALYALLTPVYTAGSQGLIYYEYYISHGGIIFTSLYFLFILKYKPRKRSWLKVFLWSQPLLLGIHIINIAIGGQANYFYTIEPPIANNPLVVGAYPMHIIMLDLFALIHFYIFYKFSTMISNRI